MSPKNTPFPRGKKTEPGTDWIRGLGEGKEGLGNVSEGRNRLVPDALGFILPGHPEVDVSPG